MHIGSLLKLWPLLPLVVGRASAKICDIPAQGDKSGDDSPAIINAFTECRKNSAIVFQNTTYYIKRALSFKDLDNVHIDVRGRLEWGTDIKYWLENSLPIGPGESQDSYPPAAYQNQTTAFILGGKRLNVEGHGYGTFDGNGQAWYDFVNGQSNYPNRPHMLVVTAEDSYFHGLRFVQPQMWTVTIVGSKNVVLEDIFVSAISRSSKPARNTDGANTMFSDNITLRRWEIENGDDSIAAKANSTNILIEDCIFRDGQGVAIGSIGQYANRFEIVENVVARNIKQYGSNYVARIKTWTGEQNEWPPNGGGGGIGYARNITWENITIEDGAKSPLIINQCYSNVAKVNCSTSTFDISDIRYSGISGTINTSRYAEFQCSRSQGGCDGIVMDDVNFIDVSGDEEKEATGIKCSNVNDPEGFDC
uniref:Pectate lyase superfamily protein domain-containing protein n=1 Tax=Bionectria ochroleuca TaxID=29856 RepID=A0A8H7KEB1_BIOOC